MQEKRYFRDLLKSSPISNKQRNFGNYIDSPLNEHEIFEKGDTNYPSPERNRVTEYKPKNLPSSTEDIEERYFSNLLNFSPTSNKENNFINIDSSSKKNGEFEKDVIIHPLHDNSRESQYQIENLPSTSKDNGERYFRKLLSFKPTSNKEPSLRNYNESSSNGNEELEKREINHPSSLKKISKYPSSSKDNGEMGQERQSSKISSHKSLVNGKYKRKPDYCYFCETEVFCFARHVIRNHTLETEVQKIISLPPKSKERRKLLDFLRKRGNYLINSSRLFKPVRASENPNRNILPCTTCLGFFSSKLLYRHRKLCSGANRGNAQSDGQNLLVSRFQVDKELKNVVFPHMRPDKISLEAKSDKLICAFGTRYLKTHRESHLVHVASRKMRELARILIEVKKNDPSINDLLGALQPKYFDFFVKATKTIANFDEINNVFRSPTLAMNMATSLKQCCDIALTLLLKSHDDPDVVSARNEANLKNMIILFQTNWKYEISSLAANNLNINKWNKLTIVPLASDLKKIKDYLTAKANETVELLKVNPKDSRAFTLLTEIVYCKTILLNRRRPGELQRILLHTYTSAPADKAGYEEFNTALSTTEQILLKNMKRVMIRGKRGRGVPVLFTSDTQKHVEVLIKCRKNFVDVQNPYLFAKPGTSNPIRGYQVLDKHAKSSGISNPSAITATRLRKHLATITQLLCMNEGEIEQLATAMGHTIGVHKNSYRLPDDVYQTAKLSKLLLLMERGEAAQFKGKTLNEIDVDMDEELLTVDDQISDKSDNENAIVENDVLIERNTVNDIPSQNSGEKDIQLTLLPKIGRKRILEPWTAEQKDVAKNFFAKHIRLSIPPKRRECEELQLQTKGLFANKTWTKIKVFIQNEYSKKKK